MDESSRGSVSNWIVLAKDGEGEARAGLYRRCYPPMVRLASSLLATLPQQAADPEAVADDAFLNFTSGLDRGGFGDLLNRTDLWQILGHLVRMRAIDQAKHQRRRVRDVDRIVSETAFACREDFASLLPALGDPHTPDPADGVAWQEEYRRLLAALSPRQRNIVILKETGFQNAEIADRFRCSTRTIERELVAIRHTFAENGFQPFCRGEPISATEGLPS